MFDKQVYDRIYNRLIPDGTCLVWNGPRDKDGYGKVTVRTKDNPNGSWRVHRLVYILEYGSIPEGLIVRHICNNPSCANITHLILGTYADNTADSLAHGTARSLHQYGELNTSSKLTLANVQYIHQLWHTGNYTQSQIAAMFNVARVTITQVINGINWRQAFLDCPICSKKV